MNSNQKLNKSKVGGNFGTVLFGACPRQFPEKRIEVLRVLKPQAVTDLVDPPVAIPQQAHGLGKHTFRMSWEVVLPVCSFTLWFR